MKEAIVTIKVTDVERRIIIKALTDLRDEQIRKHKSYDFIEDIINKSAMATTSKERYRYEER
ncbi:MAG: hypothetical protein LUG60_14690 [Erysipelotrichaceae bacterium]|nr:hypothetical protein [Erysipelotrichaceae bacterium]MCD7894920.1 hypothetical protein [Erysipelotrichaceae bacterium]